MDRYREALDEDAQVDFTGKVKAFMRVYGFLSALLPYGNPDWERLSIFLTLLVPKLPAPQEEDLSRGILEAIDMDSYRVEKQATMRIALHDADAEIGPVLAAATSSNQSWTSSPTSCRPSTDLFGNGR